MCVSRGAGASVPVLVARRHSVKAGAAWCRGDWPASFPPFLGLSRPAVGEGLERDSVGWESAPLADLISGAGPSLRRDPSSAGLDTMIPGGGAAALRQGAWTGPMWRQGKAIPCRLRVTSLAPEKRWLQCDAAPLRRTRDPMVAPYLERSNTGAGFTACMQPGPGMGGMSRTPTGGVLANDRNSLPDLRSQCCISSSVPIRDSVFVYTAAAVAAVAMGGMDRLDHPLANVEGLPETA